MSPTRLGEQPVKEVMRRQRWTISAAARELGEKRAHLVNAIYGRCAPYGRLRESLPKLLDTPLEELFTPEALADRYRRGDGYEPEFKKRPHSPRTPEQRARIAAAVRNAWARKKAEAAAAEVGEQR